MRYNYKHAHADHFLDFRRCNIRDSLFHWFFNSILRMSLFLSPEWVPHWRRFDTHHCHYQPNWYCRCGFRTPKKILLPVWFSNYFHNNCKDNINFTLQSQIDNTCTTLMMSEMSGPKRHWNSFQGQKQARTRRIQLKKNHARAHTHNNWEYANTGVVACPVKCS